MSVEPSSAVERPEEQDPYDLVSGAEQAASADAIRHQAARIIDTILADSAPENDRARELLRQQVAAHPGHPERALLEHLVAVKTLSVPHEGTWVTAGTLDAGGPVQPEFASGE